MAKVILGISCYYHDSAACLVKDGILIAAAQEERFSRVRHDEKFPTQAILYCLNQSKTLPHEIDYIAYYEKPFIKFERILETFIHFAPKGFRSFLKAMPSWMSEKIFMASMLGRELNRTFGLKHKKDKISWRNRIVFAEHHQSHAASAFFPSPFENAAVLTVDGVGEWATSSVSHGRGNQLDIINEIHFPHSLGLLYSAFTFYTGFKVNSGEYKVMGLAPYGKPVYVQKILDNLIDLKDDGSFRLNLDYFDYCSGLKMTNDKKFNALFGGARRLPESQLTQREMDLARSIQDVIELAMIKMARFAKKQTTEESLCLAGGVALNCVANGKIIKEGLFKNVWIQPAAGDAGGALGAALACWYQHLNNSRVVKAGIDSMEGGYLGPSFSDQEIESYLLEKKIPYQILGSDDDIADRVSDFIADEMVIGWFQGKMEFGPRALGARSILGDPRSPRMQSVMNLKIKHRESFRPFAPSVTKEAMHDFFDLNEIDSSPYMLVVASVKESVRVKQKESQDDSLWGIDLLNVPRSTIPAVTHVDYSARIQTVDDRYNPRYYQLIKRFGEKTGVPVLVNTSFNVRGEPIVLKPEDAYRCFMRTDMDCLVLGRYLLCKKDQPESSFERNSEWKKEFALD